MSSIGHGIGYDAITPSLIPTYADSPGYTVFGYPYGIWKTWDYLLVHFSKARLVSIDIHADEDGGMLDIESGDEVPAAAPSWVERQLHRGEWRPILYAARDEMDTVVQEMEKAGIPHNQYRILSAHVQSVTAYNQNWAHICGPSTCGTSYQADGTQWSFAALGRNLDEELLAADFWPIPPAPENHHYDRYPDDPWLWTPAHGKQQTVHERRVVQRYDAWRAHPKILSKELDKLRAGELDFLVRRLWYEIHYDAKGHRRTTQEAKAQWALYDRTYRFARLRARRDGERVTD